MRFSIWTAVSTTAQAEQDKASLTEQETKCRAAGLAKGWQETSGPYVAPGESRTRWVNLRDAEQEIPQLRAMLEDGKRGLYDILTLYDYNRLRDLLDPVAKTLASYGIQIYSISQPVEPILPEEFHPYASDSESMMRGMSQIISRWQVADLRRKYKFGVSARVRSGLPSIRIPYGYAKPPGRQQDPKVVPVQVPDQARTLLQIKEMFLAGASYREISDHLKGLGVRSPEGAEEWSHTVIRKILLNPFYAGKVFFGRRRVVRDPNGNTMRLVKNPNPLILDGKHTPLWTWGEHLAILAEIERRAQIGHNNRYVFSGLLKCSVCHSTLVHDHDPSGWFCYKAGHSYIYTDEALALIPRALQRALANRDPGAAGHTPARVSTEAALGELDRQRRRVQAAYESEVYSVEEAEARIKAIDAQMRDLKDGEMARLRKQVEHEQFLATLEQVRDVLDDLPQWIREEEPKIVNTLLLKLCTKIEITPDAKIIIHLREE